MNHPDQLHGKTALVTGASKGLGRALAHELADRGARVILVARDPERLARVADDLRARGHEAWALSADVGDPEAASAIAAQAALVAGQVDIVVHNASTLGPVPMPLLADTHPDELLRVFQVNTLGPARLTRALLGPMLLRGHGTVVGISSDAAVDAYPNWGSYGASKAALDHLLRIWSAEVEHRGVRVFSVDPGEMDTEMHAQALPDADRSALADPRDVAGRIADLVAGGAP